VNLGVRVSGGFGPKVAVRRTPILPIYMRGGVGKLRLRCKLSALTLIVWLILR